MNRRPRLTRRIGLVAILLSGIATGQYAAAATVGGVSTNTLGAGTASVSSCDNDGFIETYTTSGDNVTAVTIAGIADPTCEGGQLSLTLTDGSDISVAAGGPEPVPSDGDTNDNSITVSVSPQPLSTAIANIHVVITGP